MTRSSEKIKERNANANRKSSAEDHRSYKIHTVEDDESLSIVAREYYGNPSLWNHIYEANLDKMDDPNDIHPGQKLVVPQLKK